MELYERARRVLDEDAARQQQEKGEVIEDVSPEPAGRVVEHKYPTIVAGSRSLRS